MGRREVTGLACCLQCVLVLLLALTGVALATPAPADARAGSTPTPAPLVYRRDGNGCPRNLPSGVGGGPGRDVVGAPGNSALLLKLNNQGDPVFKAYYSPDGRIIATQASNALRLWDASNGRRIKVLPDSRGIEDSAFSPDGKELAAVIGPDTIQVFSVPAGQVSRMITVPKAVGVPGDENEPVRPLAYSRDGRLIAAGPRGAVIYVWDAASGREVLRLKPRRIDDEAYRRPCGTIWALRFSPNGQALVMPGMIAPSGCGTSRAGSTYAATAMMTERSTATWISAPTDGRSPPSTSGN